MGVKFSAQERESQISQLCEGTIYSFSGWVNGFNGNNSKFYCKCQQHGEFIVSFANFYHHHSRCPHCANMKKARGKNLETYLNDVNNIVSGKYVVVSTGEYQGNKTRIRLKCLTHGEWESSFSSIINHRSLCRACHWDRLKLRHSFSQDEAIRRAQESVKDTHLTFLEFSKLYENADSCMKIQCAHHGIFQTRFSDLVYRNTGCPSCSKHGGFNKMEPGMLYALRSCCGSFVKVGVTNNLNKRIKKLTYSTPFEFLLVEAIGNEGLLTLQLEKMFHNEFESAGFSGFDGATEWLKWTPEIQHWLRFLK